MENRFERRLSRAKTRWAGLSEKSRGRRTVLLLGVFCAVMFLLVYAPMLSVGRTFVWKVDGLSQHYPFMVRVGAWLRSAVSALFAGEPVQLFDFTLGFGGDIIQSLNYYGLGDPLLLLSAFFTPANMEVCYVLILFLRVFLAAFAFYAFIRAFGVRRKYALLGAVVYAFSLFMLKDVTLRHPLFGNAVIHLPLLLLGAEKAFQKKGALVLALAAAWSAFCGFYFLYVNAVFLLIFALIRHFALEKAHPWKRLVPTALRLIGPYAAGVCVAGVVLLPNVLGFLSGLRGVSGDVSGSLLHHAFADYLAWPVSVLASDGSAIVASVPVFAVLAAVFAFRRQGRACTLRAAVIAAVLFSILPFLKYAANGFAYITERWQYACALVAAAALAVGMPRLLHANGKGLRLARLICLGLAGYAVLIAAAQKLLHKHWIDTLYVLAAAGFAFTAFLVLWLVPKASACALRKGRADLARFASFVLAALFVLGNVLGLNWLGLYKLLSSGALMRPGTVQAQSVDSPLVLVPEAEEGDFFRSGLSVNDMDMFNEGMTAGIPSTVVYNSLIDGAVMQGMMETANGGLINANAIAGLNGRAELMALWGERYIACTDSYAAERIYGLSEVSEKDGAALFENAFALPMGYTTDRYILQSEYAAMTPAERSWALVQGAMLAEDDSRYTHIEPEKTADEHAVTVVETENVVWENGVLTVKDLPARMVLTFEGAANSQNMLVFDDLRHISGPSVRQVLVDYTVDEATAEAADVGGTFSLGNMYDNSVLHRETVLESIGWFEQPITGVTLSFRTEGTYALDDIRLVCQPMDGFESHVEVLREDVLTDLVLSTNRVSGKIELDRDKILILSIPYSKGWTAEVDGEAAEVFNAGAGLTGVKLTAGAHDVALTYFTPGLKAGFAMTAVGVLAVVGLAIFACKRRSRE